MNRRVHSELIHIRTQINSKWRLSGATIAQGGILPKIQSYALNTPNPGLFQGHQKNQMKIHKHDFI